MSAGRISGAIERRGSEPLQGYTPPMELVEERSLDQVIPIGGLDQATVCAYACQICEAVARAHENGVVYSGLTTASIRVTSAGGVRVLQPAAAIETLTAYQAPELVRRESATPASDVWALGVILHEMLVGSKPFEGATTAEIAAAVLAGRPRPLPHTVPALLRGIISRCLAKAPSHRYANAVELYAALRPLRLR